MPAFRLSLYLLDVVFPVLRCQGRSDRACLNALTAEPASTAAPKTVPVGQGLECVLRTAMGSRKQGLVMFPGRFVGVWAFNVVLVLTRTFLAKPVLHLHVGELTRGVVQVVGGICPAVLIFVKVLGRKQGLPTGAHVRQEHEQERGFDTDRALPAHVIFLQVNPRFSTTYIRSVILWQVYI